MSLHPYVKYGMALVMVNKNRLDVSEISKNDLIEEIQNGINHFRIKPNVEITDQTSVKFEYADIEKGKSLKDVAAAYKAINKDKLSLGELTREQVPVASAEVFALQEGKYSKPVESPFGWHIMKVTKILPAGQKTLEEGP